MLLRYFSQKEEGMSLVEVVVGIAILSIALIPILNYFANSTKIVYQTGVRAQALNLAQAKMEELKIKSFNNLTDKIENYGDISGYPNFKRVVDIQPNYDGNSDIKKVTVTVYWQNDNRDLTLETLITK